MPFESRDGHLHAPIAEYTMPKSDYTRLASGGLGKKSAKNGGLKRDPDARVPAGRSGRVWVASAGVYKRQAVPCIPGPGCAGFSYRWWPGC